MDIRVSSKKDLKSLWLIFKKIVALGDTYLWDSSITKDDFEKYWMISSNETYVLEDDDRIVGSYFLKPNHVGRGSHIANGSYIVDPDYQRKGVGKLMSKHSIEQAIKLGFKGIQFNMVVSTNKAAIRLWKSSGFKIIGTIPKGFNHKELGYIDAYIMYLEL